jgi:hypothetical protein
VAFNPISNFIYPICHTDTHDNFAEISQIKQIMAFLWSGKQIFHHNFIDVLCSVNNLVLIDNDVILERPSLEIPLQYSAENAV